jgi:hypothetical protein
VRDPLRRRSSSALAESRALEEEPNVAYAAAWLAHSRNVRSMWRWLFLTFALPYPVASATVAVFGIPRDDGGWPFVVTAMVCYLVHARMTFRRVGLLCPRCGKRFFYKGPKRVVWNAKECQTCGLEYGGVPNGNNTARQNSGPSQSTRAKEAPRRSRRR